jgi:phosphoribosylaminoimidazole-succinocarboxamide synthase
MEQPEKKFKKIKKIYEGKAKVLYQTNDPQLLIQYFKDDATAFDATKCGTIKDKGVCNNKISAEIFKLLESRGIRTHFVKLLSQREMLIKRVEIIPVEATVRNISAGGLTELLGIEEGIVLESPVLEYHYKNDALHDPLINDYHIKILKIASQEELDSLEKLSLKVNGILKEFLERRNLILVDFKLEFGRYKGEILLADEISPDTCRLWDKTSKEKLDKDRFRRDLGNIEEAYREVLRRLTG